MLMLHFTKSVSENQTKRERARESPTESIHYVLNWTQTQLRERGCQKCGMLINWNTWKRIHISSAPCRPFSLSLRSRIFRRQPTHTRWSSESPLSFLFYFVLPSTLIHLVRGKKYCLTTRVTLLPRPIMSTWKIVVLVFLSHPHFKKERKNDCVIATGVRKNKKQNL